MPSHHELPSSSPDYPLPPPARPHLALSRSHLWLLIPLIGPALALLSYLYPIASRSIRASLSKKLAYYNHALPQQRSQRPQPNLLTRLALKVLSYGPVPKHVAFIMDGNRRYARRLKLDTRVGHELGRQTLKKTLDWCMRLGIHTVTVYAFSIENFKRSQSEVDLLMSLAEHVFSEYAENSSMFDHYGIAVRVVGDLKLLPPKVADAAARAELATRGNKRAVLNVCIPYTSRHEMSSAVAKIVRGVERGWIGVDDVGIDVLDGCLDVGSGGRERESYDSGARLIEGPEKASEKSSSSPQYQPPVDILVRTSGEIRLSDFLLYQASENCQIHFLDVLWPEFSFWDMLPVLWAYQAGSVKERWAHGSRAGRKEREERIGADEHDDGGEEGARRKRVQRFLEKVWEDRGRECRSLIKET